LVERSINNFLNRPVTLGELKSVSLTHLEFGATTIATTAQDPNWVKLKGLRVSYNPLQYLWEQRLALTITAIQPQAYFEQGRSGVWLRTDIDRMGDDFPLRLEALVIEKAQGSLVTRHFETKALNPPVQLQLKSARIAPNPADRTLTFELDGKLLPATHPRSRLAIRGKFDGDQKTLTINVETQHLPAAPLRELLPLPLDLRAGNFTSQLAIAVKNQALVSLDGKIHIEQATLQLPQLARPLTDIHGPLIFQGQKIHFGKLQAKLDHLQAQGTGYLDWRNGFQLAIATQPLAIDQIFQALKFPRPTIPLRGQLASQINIQGPLVKPDVQVTLRQAGKTPFRIENLVLRDLHTDLKITDHRVSIRHLKAIPQSGGQIIGSGQVTSRVKNGKTEWQPFQLQLKAQAVNAQPWLPSQFKPQLPTVLPLSGQTQVQGELADPQSWQAQAQVSLPLSGGTIRSENFVYQGGDWQGDFQLQQLPVTAVAKELPAFLKSAINQGRITAQVTVQGQQGDLTQFIANGNAQVTLAQGSLTIPKFHLQQGAWQATVKGVNLPAKTFIPSPGKPSPGQLSGQIVAQGRLDQPVTEIKTSGQGRWQVGQGTIQLAQFQFQRGQWQGDLAAQSFPVNALPIASTQGRLGLVDGRLAAQGNVNQSVDQWQLFGAGQWRSPQGTVKVAEASLDNQRFKTQLTTTGLDWQNLNIFQPGQVRGNLQLAGTWTGQAPQLNQAQGDLTSTSGWQTLKKPVQVAFDWQGNSLHLDHLQSRGLDAKGHVQVPIGLVKPGFDFVRNIQQLDLQVQAQQLPLSQFVPSPAAAPIVGQLDFNGQVTGPGSQPNLQGQMAIAGLRLGDYRFSPWLTGQVQKNTQGLQLALQGQDETFRLSLDGQHQPTSVFFERQNLKLTGVRNQDQLFLTAQGLPLTALQASLPTAIAFNPNLSANVRSALNRVQQQPLAGELSGNFQLDLTQKTAIGTRVNIQAPRWGSFRGNDLTANFRFGQGQLSLENSRLRYGKSTFLMQGNANFQGQTPQWAGAISFRDSRIEDILETLHLFEWQDLQRGLQPATYGKAKDLYDQGQDPQQPLVSVGDGSESLYDQLNQLSASKARLAQPTTPVKPLPELRELRGNFEGKVTVQSNGTDPIAAQFNLQGQNWQWGDYQLEQLTVAGRWQGEAIALEPLELRNGDQFLRVTGELSPTAQTAQLQIHAVPLGPLVKLFNVPGHLQPEGNVFADFHLTGTRQDPQFQGTVQIQDSHFQNLALQGTEGTFHYQTGRLEFQLQSVVNRQTEPLILQGSVPYVFPFAQQLPESDQFSVALRLKNDSLSLLNLATNQQLTWLNGKGNVDLRLFGRLDPQQQTLYQLQGLGEITLKNAAIASQFLPNTPLTEVNGQILADLNAIQVAHLSGKISGGELNISGTLPLQNPLPNTDKALQLSLNNLAVNIPRIYQGAMAGNVEVTGTAIAPKIGGQLDLFNGNILLGHSLPTLANTPSSTTPRNGMEFQGLTLNLTDNIRVQNLPFLDFAAIGSLSLFGALNQLQPQGKITLKGGQINLFASQLRLDNSETNTVYFLPERGLDPYLDLHLTSAASETNRNNSLTRNPLSSEIDEPFSATQESLQTIRIKAQITGQASDLKNSIQLSSTPRRSEQEIITLLGGGFINTLGQDSTQTTVGLANLAGSAVLGTVQGQIGEALGLSEFRIFSTPLVNEADRLQGNQVGVAAEAGIDLTQQLGVSIQKVINSDRLPQWGLRYRINENTVIRGSSNFQDDSRGVIEFQQRF
jgi:translocation and assembly module TamB